MLKIFIVWYTDHDLGRKTTYTFYTSAKSKKEAVSNIIHYTIMNQIWRPPERLYYKVKEIDLKQIIEKGIIQGPTI